MKKTLQIMVVVLLSFGLLVGCSSQKTEGNQGEKETSKGFPVSVKDALGDKVTIKQEPKRIVSLAPSNTEIAYELGLGSKMVGVSDFDNYPEEVNKVEKIGGQQFNVEKIISLKPDLVLAHEMGVKVGKDGLKQLKDAGIPVFVVKNAQSFETTYETIQTIGQLTGKESKAKEIVANMKKDVEAITEKAKNIKEEKTVYVEIAPAPNLFTAGKNTFIDEMLQMIHAKNAAGSLQSWAQITEEDAVKLNPDVIVTTYGYSVKDAADQVYARPAWKNVSAVKNKQVYDVNSDLVSRPGPRLVKGVEEFARVIYPDVFAK